MIQTKSSIKSTLFSPINGSISYINSIPSKPNEKIVQINSNERIIRANISESELNLLKINQNISVTSSDNTQFTSKIKEISNIPSKIKMASHITTFHFLHNPIIKLEHTLKSN